MFYHIFFCTTGVWKSCEKLPRVADISFQPKLKLRSKIQKSLLIKIRYSNTATVMIPFA